jgi:predicted RNA binding protein YcfA (HicA-like mRNA interferase family)
LKSRDLIKLLQKNGWVLVRIKGSHHIFKHPDFTRPIPVPHPKKDVPTGTLNAILKQAGIK